MFDPGRYPQDAELAASIRQHGVIEPILVYRFSDPGEDPQYRLIAGDRRRRAAAHIGQEMIPAIIRQSGDQINLLTFAENTGRRDLTPYEKAIALAKIMDMDEEVLSFRQLAKKTGVSLSSVSNLLKAYRESPPALRKLFAEGMESRAVVELQSVFGKYGEAELTGAPRKTVKEIFSTAEKNRSGMDAVFLACAFVGRGGTPCNALKNAESLTQKKKAFKLVHKYLILRNKAKDFIDHVDEDSQKEFLNTIFWGE
ncbi:MAG: ParB/RepB/Spo0J family partition protein [Anaerolineales bacterium]